MAELNTVTVVFSDLVGSTAMAVRLGEEAADEVRRAHFDGLFRAVERTGGEVAKNTGDGLMVVYRSAADGVAGAVAMQQEVNVHNRRGGEPLDVRVGVSTGDAALEYGDWFGTSVIESARLCAHAQGGQVLVSEVVRVLTGGRGGHVFGSVGALNLKGLPEPVTASEVRWEPVPTGSGLALPPTLRPRAERRFVGRRPEIERLEGLAKAAFAGERRLVLVAGEPGIGKTRLSTELAVALHSQGATVLLGQCDEDLAAPYRPFVEALRYLIVGSDHHDLRDWLSRGGPELGRILPELAERLPDLDEPQYLNHETERLLLFEAVDALLSRCSTAWPVLLILEDLHWADKASLLLLRHLARSTEPGALLVVGTYRAHELSASHPLTETLADLRRNHRAERLSLNGLDEGATADLITARIGQAPEAAFTQTLLAETDGNPFFLGEMLEHLSERHEPVGQTASLAHVGVPDSVREVIGHRLVRLSDRARALLATASIVGRDFDLEMVAAVSGSHADDLLDALDEAAASRLIQESGHFADRYSFSHALVRATLADALSSARRIRLHRSIASALEARFVATHEEELLPSLAFHFGVAVALGEEAKAAEYGLRAGRSAREQLDYEGAATLLEKTLANMDHHGPVDREMRCDVLLALADARLQTGNIPGFRQSAEQVADEARALGSAERVAEAALLYREWGFAHRTIRTICQQALEILDDDQLVLRAKVISLLAATLFDDGKAEEAIPLSAEAVALARKAGDDVTLGITLVDRIDCLVGSGQLTARSELAHEAIALGGRTGDHQLLFYGHARRAVLRLEMADVAGFDADRKEAQRFAEAGRSWIAKAVSSSHAALLALLQGRFEEVEELSGRILTYAPDDVAFVAIHAGQIFLLRREQGRLHEVVPLLIAAVNQDPGIVGFRAALALARADQGDLVNAQHEFTQLATDKFCGVPRDLTWLQSLAILAEVCAHVRDPSQAVVLYDLLRPHEGHLVVGGSGVACLGAVDRFLAMLARTAGRWDQADAHFAAAMALESSIESQPLLARTRMWYGRMLLDSQRAGDEDRASNLLGEALATAQALGMKSVVAECETLLGKE